MRRSAGSRASGVDAGAQFFQHVVEAGQGEVRMLGEDALAMGVEVFGDGANALLLQVVGGGEGEGVEALRFRVARVDPQASLRCADAQTNACATTTHRERMHHPTRSLRACCLGEHQIQETEIRGASWSRPSLCSAASRQELAATPDEACRIATTSRHTTRHLWFSIFQIQLPARISPSYDQVLIDLRKSMCGRHSRLSPKRSMTITPRGREVRSRPLR